MGMQHTPGLGKVSIGHGSRTFERNEKGELEFDVASPVYGELSFIDFWLCDGYDDERDPEAAENAQLKAKIASAVESRGVDIFRGFEQELRAEDANSDVVFDNTEDQIRLSRRRGYR